MESAGDVAGGDVWENLHVIADREVPVAFAEVAVDVDGMYDGIHEGQM